MSTSSSAAVPARLLFAALAAAGFSSAASAVTVTGADLSRASYNESLYASYNDGVGLGVPDTANPGSLVHSEPIGNGGAFSVVATTHGGSSPSLSVDATASGDPNHYVNASARIQYQLELTGAPYGTLVPMTVAVAAQVSSAGDVSDAYARVSIENNYLAHPTTIRRETDAWTPGGVYSNSFAEVIPFDMVVGTLYSVDVYGAASTYQGGGHVFIDPTFSFVNAADAGQYTLAFSPGLMPAVPEPAPIAMGGVGLAFLAMRWARRKLRD